MKSIFRQLLFLHCDIKDIFQKFTKNMIKCNADFIFFYYFIYLFFK